MTTSITAEASNRWFSERLRTVPVIAIFRGLGTDRTVELAAAAWATGLSLVEIPIQSAADVEALRATVALGAQNGYPVGAGTVTTPQRVLDAKAAGAAFTIAPGLDRRILGMSLEHGMPHLPGVASPTDVQRAAVTGVTWMKAFPARSLGLDWFAAMTGPFPDIRMVATGGITADNAGAFLRSGAHAVAVGHAASPAELRMLVHTLGKST